MNSLFTNNISLDHGTHTYQLLDDPEFRFASVTEFIHEFFRKFEGEITYKGGGVLPMSGTITNFVKGNYTNNALLWGARGNGKSTRSRRG